MKKSRDTVIATVVIILAVALAFLSLFPLSVPTEEGRLAEFSTVRALKHVSEISSEPHFVGTEAHRNVREYIKRELRQMNLEVSEQQGTSLTEWGNLTKSKNIVARIRGSQNSKALLLLSHYDSAPHSASPGASDDASGVATILEGLRAFLHANTPHKNDIIILFSDAEELGLNGAAVFAAEHPWAKDVGLVLNFEARGTAGPSYMLMETNTANAALVSGFKNAKPEFPVANSLMYSIYKMMPNDTDLTIFRERANIPGYNFAFIDDHFNYHTAQDDVDHLDHRSLKHQGTYLMSMLGHFGNADLTDFSSDEDLIYFNVPFAFLTYSFSWTVPLLIVAAVLFAFFVFIGLGRRLLTPTDIVKGFVCFLGSAIVAGATVFFVWKLILLAYPEYGEILQGFTYNGHTYILAFCALSMAINFLIYSKSTSEVVLYSYLVAPVCVWLIIITALALYLPGAGFFVIPVIGSVLTLGFYTLFQRSNIAFSLLMSLPAIFIFVPLVWMLPIGLGLKLLAGSAVLISLLFGLMLSVLGGFRGKPAWAVSFGVISIGLLVYAHVNADFEPGKAKPNSLVYYYDADLDDAYFATYDAAPDEWTQTALGDNPVDATMLNRNKLFSKYNSVFTLARKIEPIEIESPTITFELDTVEGNWRHMKIRVEPNRTVNRYDIFAPENLRIHNLRANGATLQGQKGTLHKRKGRKILSYYVVDNQPLFVEFTIPAKSLFDLELMESSFDLLNHPDINISARPDWMMPKPFILNDAVVLKQKLKATPAPVRQLPIAPANVLTPDSVPQPPVPPADSIPDL